MTENSQTYPLSLRLFSDYFISYILSIIMESILKALYPSRKFLVKQVGSFHSIRISPEPNPAHGINIYIQQSRSSGQQWIQSMNS